MKRRNISIGGKTLSQRQADFDHVKKQLKEKFNDGPTLDKLVQYLLTTGWDVDDTQSMLRQANNGERPPVQAFLFHHEHVLDQVMLNQGTYTHMQDTAQDPNYAIRHPGQTELILRRLTPGDLLMLDAAHAVSIHQAHTSKPSEEDPIYWENLYAAMVLRMIYDNPVSGNEKHWYFHRQTLIDNSELAAATSIAFCLTTKDTDGEFVSNEDLSITFFQPTGRFYTGLQSARQESVRIGDSYQTSVVFPGNPTRENFFMTAAVLLCYGIDNVARDELYEERRRHLNYPHYYSFINHVRSKGVAKTTVMETETNADNPPQNDTRSFFNRLLP